MLKQGLVGYAALTLLAASAVAQSLVMSPEVHADGRVTFRLEAPDAEEAVLVPDWGDRQPLEKGEGGLWTLTVGPLPPATYIYAFEVDGIPTVDPINPIVKLRARGSASLVTVPGSPAALWDLRDVEHGGVTAEWKKSELLEHDPIVTVYTPPGYNDDSSRRYPVLYLLHGNNDTPVGWTMVGKANWIADNLIAEGEMTPMIIVMPFGHAVPYSSPREKRAGNTDLFERYLLDEVIPMVEERYRVHTGRENRAIVGLSMGGGHSTTIGFSNLDRFSAIAAFSGTAGVDLPERAPGAFKDADETNDLLDFVWIGVGRQDTPALERSEAFSAMLKDKGVEHELVVTEGVHNYAVWQRYLARVLPMLFRNE